jgi:hypothetical protein
VRRIGEVIREQVELYGTLTGRAPTAPREQPAAAPDQDLADVLQLPQRERRRRAQ